jgi:hypothetical protein
LPGASLGKQAVIQGSNNINIDVVKEMQNAIHHASMMREARADDKSNILTAQHKAAVAAAMFLSARFPVLGVPDKDQSGGMPDLPVLKRWPRAPWGPICSFTRLVVQQQVASRARD